MSVGISKVQVAHRYIRSVNGCSAVTAYEADLSTLPPGALSHVHAAAVAVDSLHARVCSTRLLFAARVPHVDLGVHAGLWQGRATVCAPSAVAEGREACLACGFSQDQRRRAGIDVGAPCAAVPADGEFPSALAPALAVAALGAREVLALTGAVPLTPSSGRELRYDLRALRSESVALPPNPDCGADHALAGGELTELSESPGTIALEDVLGPDGAHVKGTLALSRELAASAVCSTCFDIDAPWLRADRPLAPCASCGAPRSVLRRARRVRLSDVSREVLAMPADRWFEPGDVFAEVERPRAWRFRGGRRASEAGRPLSDAEARERFKRLPPDWDLGAMRRTRIAVLGVGHLGAALLQSLAALPWREIVIVDRDPSLELHNLQSHALVHLDPGARAALEKEAAA